MSMELEEAIKQTKKTFKPIISKPKCTTKLLSKPPFRFIHDIITATMTSTGFPKNYFTAHELESKNLKDKTSKVAFLNKLIYLVGVCTGSEVHVRPSKIVAGLEPIHTNVLLTLFGNVAVNPSVDHTAAIKHCQFGGKIEDFSSRNMVDLQTGSEEEEKKQDFLQEEEEEDRLKRREHSETRQDLPLESKDISDEASKPFTTKSPHLIMEAKGLSDGSSLVEEESKVDIVNSLHEKIQQCNGDPISTREIISRITSKPKCTKKLLEKPPFRFLHDLIIAINKKTGLELENIFSHDEMDSSKVKTKETKIIFLEKILDYVKYRLHISIDLRPSKVVAGLEPEKTCHFLQLLGTLALHQDNVCSVSKEEIQQNDKKEVNEEKLDMSSQAKDEYDCSLPNAQPSKSDSKEFSVEHQINNDIAEKSSRNLIENLSTGGGSKQKDSDIPPNLMTTSTADAKSISFIDSSNGEQEPDLPKDEEKLDEHKSNNADGNNIKDIDDQYDGSKASNVLTDPKATEGVVDISIDESKEEKISIEKLFFGTDKFQEQTIVDDVKHDVRPKTARRRPPKIKDRVQSADKRRLTSMTKKPVIFKEDNDDLIDRFHSKSNRSQSLDQEGEEKESRIDQSTKLHLHFNEIPGDKSVPSSSSLTTTKRRIVETTLYELDAIARSIQNIARAAAPIGGVMDYLPTEMNTMTKESNYWTDECERQKNELYKAKKNTNEELDTLLSEIDAAENEIKRMSHLVLEKKIQIAENDQWMKNHMRRICQQ